MASDLSTPVTTRNSVMRPANGSATVFHTHTARGPAPPAVAVASAPVFGCRPVSGRSAGDGTYDTMASASGWMPMFVVAEVHKTGKTLAAATALRRPAVELVLRQRSRVEEFLHQRFVRFGHHLDQRVAGPLAGSLHRARLSPSTSSPDPSAGNVNAFIADEIDDALEVLLLADRELNRHRSASERLMAAIPAIAPGWRARDRAG